MAFQKRFVQAVKFAKFFTIFTACLWGLSSNAYALPSKLCTYFYDFNFHDPLLQKQEIRRAIKAMVFSNQIKFENGTTNHHILPKALHLESESHWEPVIVEQLLNRNGVKLASPLKLTLVYENQKPHVAIARQMLRSLAQSDLIQVKANGVNKSEWQAQYKKGKYHLIRNEQCVEKADPALFLWRFSSQSAENKNGYANPKVDSLLLQLKKGRLNKAKRNRLIQQIVEILEQDVAILPLYEFSK